MNILNETEQVVSTRRLDLLEKIWNRVKPEDKKNQYISSIMHVTHDALNASASSLLTLDKNEQELVFQFADGPVAQQLKRLQINKKSGIAGWIISNGKPLIVNDAEKNRNFYKRIDEATGFKTGVKPYLDGGSPSPVSSAPVPIGKIGKASIIAKTTAKVKDGLSLMLFTRSEIAPTQVGPGWGNGAGSYSIMV